MTVLAVENGRVRLGFEAPDEVKIFRTEIADKDRRAPRLLK